MYELNVSLNGHHHFATDERSIDSVAKAQKIKSELEKIYTEADGYKITCSRCTRSSQQIELPPIFQPPVDIKYAVRRLIDSVWTLSYRYIGNKQVEIISHDRENPIGYEQEKSLLNFHLNEDCNRIVQSVDIDGAIFEVVNKKHVFSYLK